MPLDLPTDLVLAQADLKALNEELNGLENTKCALRLAPDQARVQVDIDLLTQWLRAIEAYIVAVQALLDLGYPIFPLFRVAVDMKERIQAELRASVVADRLYVGVPNAVGGRMNFGGPIPAKP